MEGLCEWTVGTLLPESESSYQSVRTQDLRTVDLEQEELATVNNSEKLRRGSLQVLQRATWLCPAGALVFAL